GNLGGSDGRLVTLQGSGAINDDATNTEPDAGDPTNDPTIDDPEPPLGPGGDTPDNISEQQLQLAQQALETVIGSEHETTEQYQAQTTGATDLRNEKFL